jgi:hypothetical protein
MHELMGADRSAGARLHFHQRIQEDLFLSCPFFHNFTRSPMRKVVFIKAGDQKIRID